MCNIEIKDINKIPNVKYLLQQESVGTIQKLYIMSRVDNSANNGLDISGKAIFVFRFAPVVSEMMFRYQIKVLNNSTSDLSDCRKPIQPTSSNP